LLLREAGLMVIGHLQVLCLIKKETFYWPWQKHKALTLWHFKCVDHNLKYFYRNQRNKHRLRKRMKKRRKRKTEGKQVKSITGQCQLVLR
jgi:hypothetical protein